MQIKIYHNPRCSKSRQTLALLKEKNITPEIIEYLKNPPSKDELKAILRGLGKSPRELIRKNEPEYSKLNLANDALSDEQLISIMLEHPKLIERPIVVAQNRYAIGRPPESVLAILAA